jgi:hypothetical protein
MPVTVFQIKGIPGHRRERIETAVIAGGRHASGPHEAWIAAAARVRPNCDVRGRG